MSPNVDRSEAPLYASTPLTHAVSNNLTHPVPVTNGHDVVDNLTQINHDTINGNVNVNIASESNNNMDVLSGGESDAGDTLSRRNNNSISSGIMCTLREGEDAPRRRVADITYFIAKELLMTERTYKRDLELVTVTWSSHVSRLAESCTETAASLARPCLALEPLALAQGALLAKLERMLAGPSTPKGDDPEEPEYKKIGEILFEYLSNIFEAYSTYIEVAGTLVGLVEGVRRSSEAALRECNAFEAAAPLPLACLVLRPLHRAAQYERIAADVCRAQGGTNARAALELARRAARLAAEHLRHGENHATLCQLQRDILGYDKLLVAEREFVRLGSVYKHSSKGLQQRMLYLFNDLLLVTSKSGGARFRTHAALPLYAIEVKPAELPNSFTVTGEDVSLTLSASNEQEFLSWIHTLEDAVDEARQNPTHVDTELTSYDSEAASCVSGGSAGALWPVCWHRVTSLSREHLHLAMASQQSGYLLRKFKNSHGWQKLWVVFAAFTLFFYKGCLDAAPLASLPLLGYSVGPPAENDGIRKDFVFKLHYKNHVYFFRADSFYTYNRWIEVLKTAMVHPHHSEH